MTDKLLGALGLARKAGKLRVGFDAVCDSAAQGEVVLVLLARDLSPKTAKRVHTRCVSPCEVMAIHLTQQDIAAIAGKPAGVLGLADTGLAALCKKQLAE
ncbi:MAG: 50S ribosomal protein L7ae [Ruminococcaceae bacterium]|nr:50S ribosomal protein L7ae [Oscillospiraceae bacterium]